MSGIYIHIPFCKQACHYCDFHFSTSLKKKDELIAAICTELKLRKDELHGEVETIYFGGGTPSLLTSEEIETILTAINEHFELTEFPEITLEANPDDLTEATLTALADSPINRLSIGVQSFFEEDLKLMNRAHDAAEAEDCIKLAQRHFDNLSIDLIYGIPGMNDARWIANIEKALSFTIPHLSCYALTVEPKTALKNFIEKGLIKPVSDEQAQAHHSLLVEKMETAGYDNYEFSNFSKPGQHSRNNTAYWHGKPYLGVGPSAHSFDCDRRSWNIANNALYIKGIDSGVLPLERETLSDRDKYNEYVMTRLRVAAGISLEEVASRFGSNYLEYLQTQARQFLELELLELEANWLKVTKKGKFLSDGIASDLFKLRD